MTTWTGILTGTVVAFDAAQGLGEVEDGEGRRYPFHCTRIANGARDNPVGARVEFTVAPGHLGRWEAVGIRPVAERRVPETTEPDPVQ